VAAADPIPSALPAESACATQSPGPRVLRRLSAVEFAASIKDLFQDATAPVAAVFNDRRVLGFTVDSSALIVEGLNADQLMTNAEAVASWAVQNHLSQIASCTTLDATCGKQFIKSFGRRAFRTTLADTDPRIDAYNKLFLAETKFSDGVAAVLAAMLQSPYFLYRSELGDTKVTGNTVTLTPFEVANSLSYLLTGSMPDTALLAAADSVAGGSLTLSAMVDQQATRLLSLATSQDAIMNFMSGWLGLDRLYTSVKDDTVFKLSDALRDDMAKETRSFILDTFASSSNGSVANLFTANYTFLNKELATYYGLDTSGLSTSFSKVPLSATARRDGGILAHASILTGYARADISSPTQRGHLVRSRLLCQDVPPPPAGLDTKFQPAVSAMTTRDHYLNEHASPSRAECYGCHRLMDLIGVSFEHYDSFGAYRDTENSIPIDATGTIMQANTTDGDVAVNGLSGPNGLQTYLGGSDDLKQCLVRYWSYYAYGSASWAEDGCTYQAIQKEAASNAYSLKSVLMALIHAPHFTARAQTP
jgi:hypothetical protein